MIKNTFTNSIYFVVVVFISFVALTGCNPKESKNASASTTTTASTSSNSSVEGDIAYVNVDSLNVYYNYLVDISDKTEKKQLEIRRQLEQSEIKLQADYESLQKRASQGLLSENAAKKEQQDLQTQVQMLDRQKASMSEAFRLQSEKDLNKAFSNIESVLEEYKAEKGYRVVLGVQKGMSMILYTDKNLDITKPVLELLNEKYKTEQDSAEVAN
ncbi:outer membrane protein [Bernardetia litoralis DSM 6794]|uniref:Outer membrane protein n=1 Tax=Bernardetia litoralis (strain ATCC 23117 / DSM 6794 / NBRC 15988 / NCIMB 1366 / Fx l1 / Sio-4) TaxID=880071 RepID=I4AFT9_BERLS|nr:OmpH family outer membrane protein [Bernardetia litoralis]AFM02824.1 outer membrane protein [Bernardetia litoralis DSM 6794]